ncbi:MAG: hypothetical protein RIS29_2018 [Bacteroidota bacterium]|jgi:hypothetical protein
MMKRLLIYIAGIMMILSAVCYSGADRLCTGAAQKQANQAIGIADHEQDGYVLQPRLSVKADEVLHSVHSFQFHQLTNNAHKSLQHGGRLILHTQLVQQKYLVGLSHSQLKAASLWLDGYYLYFLRKILL